MNKKLAKQTILRLFNEYKVNKSLTTQNIADENGVDRTTINNYFKEIFGEEYISISKIKRKTVHREHSLEQRLKISKALKNLPKPSRSLQHRINLGKAMSKSYEERFGKKRAIVIKEKIGIAHLGKKKIFRDKELWRNNLSNSLKGRIVWNKGLRGVQKAWNKKDLPIEEILKLYVDQKISADKIAKRFNVHKTTILEILKNNCVNIRNTAFYIKGKTLEEISGSDIATNRREHLSKLFKGRTVTWSEKIQLGLKRYYQERKLNNIVIHRHRNPLSQEQRLNLSVIHKKYLENHPEELERLKLIQYPGKISAVEQKMLDFLKKHFIEREDFYFDTLDTTKKTLYRPDFQFPKQKIILEIDGYYKHFTSEGFKKDKIRQYYLEKAGWTVYRFNFYDIAREYKFKLVKEKLLALLRQTNVDIRN